MTYLLGWSVIPQILIRRERWPGGYKTRAIPLVKRGQDVLPDQPVLRLKKMEPIEEVDDHSAPLACLPSWMLREESTIARAMVLQQARRDPSGRAAWTSG